MAKMILNHQNLLDLKSENILPFFIREWNERRFQIEYKITVFIK
jgi:hypothetical protein